MSVRVEVAYAGPEGQYLLGVVLSAGATVADAVHASGIRVQVPSLVIDDAHVGIWSRPCGLAAPVRDGDRVEIYRDLQADPKAMRRSRALDQLRKPK